MPVDPATAIYNLMQRDPSIIAAVVVQGRDTILYTTDNWDISSDVGKVSSSWSGMNAQSVMISGVKYSVLQCEQERLVAISMKGEGSICAAKDEEHKIICYLDPDGDARGAIMDVQRAVSSLSSQQSYIDPNAQLGSVTQPSAPNIDPQLKGEIQSFVEWIKDGEGLSGYINYYMQQNNAQIISELSKIYAELRQIFGV